jgi:hypothetical protein
MRVTYLVLATTIASGQPARDPSAVLEQARSRFRELSRNLEKYVCTETIQRSYYRRTSIPDEGGQVCSAARSTNDPLEIESTDRVRLEVSVAEGRELHSWPGATRFETRDVDELIRNGPVSTGGFGGDLSGVFDHAGVTFSYRGERSVNGKLLYEYHYMVPVDASRFEVKGGGAHHPVAYEGEFQLDPESLELESLTIRADELPSDLPICSATTTLDYRRVHIGNSDLLLPSRSALQLELKYGRFARNITTYASCREYQAESAINFDTVSTVGSTTTSPAGRFRVALPIGVPVTLALEGAIDTDSSCTGDPIAARVIKPVRLSRSTQDVIPAGAIVRGRVRRVEHHLSPTPYFLIAISFNRIEFDGYVAPFAARHEADQAVAKEVGANLALRETGTRLWAVGTFLFRTSKSRIVLPAGSESQWFTLSAASR